MRRLRQNLRGVHAATGALGRTEVPGLREDTCPARAVSLLRNTQSRWLRDCIFWLRLSLIVPGTGGPAAMIVRVLRIVEEGIRPHILPGELGEAVALWDEGSCVVTPPPDSATCRTIAER